MNSYRTMFLNRIRSAAFFVAVAVVLAQSLAGAQAPMGGCTGSVAPPAAGCTPSVPDPQVTLNTVADNPGSFTYSISLISPPVSGPFVDFSGDDILHPDWQSDGEFLRNLRDSAVTDDDRALLVWLWLQRTQSAMAARAGQADPPPTPEQAPPPLTFVPPPPPPNHGYVMANGPDPYRPPGWTMKVYADHTVEHISPEGSSSDDPALSW